MNSKKSLLLIALISFFMCFFVTGYSSQIKAPIDEHGGLSIKLITSDPLYGKSDYWGNTMADIPEAYIKRFGAFPTFMLWEDLPDSVRIIFRISFQRNYYDYSKYNPPAPSYPLDMTWGDAKKFFFWRLVNSKTGETTFEPVKVGDDKKTIVTPYYSNSWYRTLDFDAKRLPVPNDGSAREVTLEMFENEPQGATEKPLASSRPFIVVRTKRTTELDTLQWASHESLLNKDIPLCRRLNTYFPNDILLIRKLLLHYSDQKQLDSLEYFSREYIRVMKERSACHFLKFPMNGDTLSLPRPITNGDYEFVQKVYKRAAGDTLDLGPRDIPPYEEKYGKMIIQ